MLTLTATQQLADKQMLKLNSQEDSGLRGTVDLTNQVAVCLARIYQRGFTVDLQALDGVRQEFEQESVMILSVTCKRMYVG